MDIFWNDARAVNGRVVICWKAKMVLDNAASHGCLILIGQLKWKLSESCPQLWQWVTVLYNDISSCVLNNGFATNHFILSRGVRQGCPLSGILFVIGIEILSNAIRRSSEIKGIQIKQKQTVKITQYADDTTVFLRDVQSVHILKALQSLKSIWNLLWPSDKPDESKSELLNG